MAQYLANSSKVAKTISAEAARIQEDEDEMMEEYDSDEDDMDAEEGNDGSFVQSVDGLTTVSIPEEIEGHVMTMSVDLGEGVVRF